MNNFHIYEEVGRGKYSVVYKVLIDLLDWDHVILTHTWQLGQEEEDYWLRGSEVSWEI